MRSVFRKVALDRLSSPEQLDTLMQVTSPMSWLGLLGVLALLALALYWGVAGTIPNQLTASTILLPPGGIKNLVATSSGQITQVRVQPGDTVRANEPIADVLPLGSAESVPVTSLLEGRILEVKLDVGSLVRQGEAIANLAFVGDDMALEATLYLSPEDGRRVTAGMPVKIAPRGGGSLLYGTVAAVGDFPVSRAGILRILGSDELAQTLVSSPTPIEVRVLLDADSAALARANGLAVGTLASATILLGEQRPIDLIK